MCITSAAPIMKHTLDFFMSIDLPLMEIYGMSESTGICETTQFLLTYLLFIHVRGGQTTACGPHAAPSRAVLCGPPARYKILQCF